MLDDPQTQYLIIVGLLCVTAVVWLFCALSAFFNYRGFTQRADLGSGIAFVALAVVRASDAYVAFQWYRSINIMSSTAQNLTEDAGFYRINFVAIEMLAAFAIFYFFRQRRSGF